MLIFLQATQKIENHDIFNKILDGINLSTAINFKIFNSYNFF